MSAIGKRYLALIHELPCIIHLRCYGERVMAQEAHHLEFVRGDHSDFASIPMCNACHTYLHKNHRRAFYTAHKLDDVKLLSWTAQAVMELHESR